MGPQALRGRRLMANRHRIRLSDCNDGKSGARARNTTNVAALVIVVLTLTVLSQRW